jgi:predicted nucleic acid-binding protein
LILLDTSGLLASYDEKDPAHVTALAALQESRPPRLVSPFVLAETDYLVGRNVGREAQLALLDEIAGGGYELAPMSALDVADARDVCQRYADLDVGLADASLVVLSRRHGVHDVLTLDERHFRVLRGARDRPFRILPADA